MNVSEEEFQNWLEIVFDHLATIDEDENEPVDYDEEGNGIYPDGARTFDSVGMLTLNKGLVVTLSDGSEFQLTIVKSK